MYRSLIYALAKKAQLRPGFCLLDAGCGQGFFAGLFADLGIQVVGVDLSTEALKSAPNECSSANVRFEAGDVRCLPYESTFDCVYARSCSLYNKTNLEESRQITDKLLTYLKDNGILIFDYYTRLSGRKGSVSWRYHNLSAIKSHFAKYPDARVYFSLRLEPILFGSWALSAPITLISSALSRISGIGGEAIVFVRRSGSIREGSTQTARAHI